MMSLLILILYLQFKILEHMCLFYDELSSLITLISINILCHSMPKYFMVCFFAVVVRLKAFES